MPGKQPPDTPDDVLAKRLGKHAQPSDDKREQANALIELMLGDERLSANKALKRLGLNWSHLHRWKASHPQWYAAYRDARDTLADSLADQARDLYEIARKDLLSLEGEKIKLGTALGAVWRDEARMLLAIAERTSNRWRPDVLQVVAPLHVVVMLPPLTGAQGEANSIAGPAPIRARIVPEMPQSEFDSLAEPLLLDSGA